MKRAISFLLFFSLAISLAGCISPGSATQSAGPSPPAQSGGSAAPSQAAGPAGDALQIFLPAEKEALQKLLQNVGGQQDKNVEIRTAAAGMVYEQALAQALESDTPPDLFWVESASGAAALQEQNHKTLDFGAETSHPALRALAGMIPENLRFAEEDFTGLPLGYYAEGTLVNITLLAALLNAGDMQALRRDLVRCSWEEWNQLAGVLTDYLAQPRRLSTVLNGNTYTTPRHRPDTAQQCRGLYAVATASPENYLNAGLSAAWNLALETPEDAFAMTPQEKTDAITPALPLLLGFLDFETVNMTQSQGALSRGENFAAQARISTAEAQQMIANGTVLFSQNDSREGLFMETELPSSRYSYTMVPIKFPPVREEQQEGASGSGQEDEAESDADTAKAQTEQKETVEENNTKITIRADGCLCINAATERKEQAEALLVQLLTSDAGRQSILQDLHLLPVADSYPAGFLPRQLASAISDKEYHPAAMPPSSLQGPQKTIGEWIDGNLMAKEEWTEEDTAAFTAVALSAFGLPLPGRE